MMTRRNTIGTLGNRISFAFHRLGIALLTLGMAIPSLNAEELTPKSAANPNATRSPAESAESLAKDLKYLTSEELAGRSAVGPEILKAADYIAERYREIGLETRLYGDSPMQPVEMATGSQPTSPDDNRLRWSSPGTESTEIELENQFMPLAIGTTQGDVEADIVWVGYGIRAAELGYDDYAAFEQASGQQNTKKKGSVEGKIVMMLRKEPGFADPNSPFDGVKNTRHAFFDTKISTAIDQGAVGVLLVNDPVSTERLVQAIHQRYRAEEKRLQALTAQLNALPAEATNLRAALTKQLDRVNEMLGNREREVAQAQWGLLGVAEAGMRPLKGNEKSAGPQPGKSSRRPAIPVASISREAADRLLKQMASLPSANKDGDSRAIFAKGLTTVEQAIDADYKPKGIASTGLRGRLQVGLTQATATSPNVLGVLEGKGKLADETVVIGAHYDHVGMGGMGSLAPGTIEIHNGADDNASGTSTMLAVAERVVEQLNQTTAHRRIVFIAFTGEERGLLGSKHYCSQPRFPISNTVAMLNMDMVGRLRDNELTVYGTGTSAGFETLVQNLNKDMQQTSRPFKLNLVPTGYGPSDHASFYEAGVPVLFFFTGLHSDYHRPSDDFEKLNLDGMTRITDIVSQAANRVATMDERPPYTQTNKDFQIRHQMTVVLGIQMDPNSNEVAEVMDPSAAKEGGIQVGDQLIKAGDRTIQTVNDLREELRPKSPGDSLRLTIQRDQEQMELNVRLRAR
ncbi:M20/M25/M40 family metallo-hydrolase [Rhodopirellula sp. P2]|uniref:M20/M25/M40 family metallo-hydrolase n=1 Tax=Rhodopirellula sp. P2 TaxID=2127060 RepID=UPI002368145D|nr:M20/M25/M40 family metallo-hydrolase [Rhodopirellula sp. P2]WDQ14760.1 M28 family peptidase [Rhodopirellula sp. P2]